MRVLVACEYSGVVREAFRARGHDAYSCDVLPAEDGSPYHYQAPTDENYTYLQNLIEFLEWDLLIAHPPCTYLCNSGVWALKKDGEWDTERWANMQRATDMFMTLLNSPVPKIAVENPVPHKYGGLPRYSQIIQPYQFGDDASKRTCLWLKGLPPLQTLPEDLWAKPRIVNGKSRWSNQTDAGQNRLTPSPMRAHLRSRTYDGIAKAFADQWG